MEIELWKVVFGTWSILVAGTAVLILYVYHITTDDEKDENGNYYD